MPATDPLVDTDLEAKMSVAIQPLLAAITAVVTENGQVASEQALAERLNASSTDVERAALEAYQQGLAIGWRRSSNERGWTTAPVSSRVAAASAASGWTIDAEVDEFTIETLLMSIDTFSMVTFVEEVLRADASYTDVAYSDRFLVDLSATRAGRQIYFETRRTSTTSSSAVTKAIDTRTQLRAAEPNADLVLVVAGLLTPAAGRLASAQGLTCWDRATLASSAPKYVVENYLAALRREARLDRRAAQQQRGKQLLDRLKRLQPGTAGALPYQRLVRDLVEYLFVPPLGVPEFEVRNALGTDRRDIIMENPARDGLWSLWRQHYRAEFIVIDAKNHSRPLKKREIVDVAHYLKWYGPGLFAIVAHRDKLGPSARAAIREQWIASERMIVAVNDVDFQQMVELRGAASHPEAILAERIRAFRLSL